MKKLTKNQLEKDIFNEKIYGYVDKSDHAKRTHTDKDISYNIERIITKDKTKRKNASSSYTMEFDYREMLECALLDNTNEITTWINDPESPEIQKFTTEEILGGPIIGQGVKFRNGKIKAYKTKVSEVVLEKDNSPNNPYGFTIKTLYPDINCSQKIPWDIDLAPYMKMTPTYQNASTNEKLRLEQMTKRTAPPKPTDYRIHTAHENSGRERKHAGAARRLLEKAENMSNHEGHDGSMPAP